MRRKGEQRGTLRNRNGNWHVEFSAWVKDEEGNLQYKRLSRLVGPSKGKDALSRRTAEQVGYDKHVAPANGQSHIPQGLATVQQFVETRFQVDHIDHLKKSSRIFYRTMLDNHVLPTLGGFALRDVTPHVVQVLIGAKVDAGLSSQTITHIRTVVSAIYRHARGLGFYEGALPTEGVRLPTLQHEERQALTLVQIRLLIAAIPETYRPLIVLLVETGLRIGEALGLRWQNVNLSNEWKGSLPPHSLLVCENWTKGERTTVKTRTSRRVVPLTSAAWVALQSIAETTKFNGPEQPVFAGRYGQPLDAHNLSNRVLKPAGKKAGVKWVNFHCLRHTNATFADQMLTAAEKQKVLGHATASMSAHYTHPDAERVRKALEDSTPGVVQ